MGLFWASPAPPAPPPPLARPQPRRWDAKTKSELQLEGVEVDTRPDHITAEGIEYWYVPKESQ